MSFNEDVEKLFEKYRKEGLIGIFAVFNQKDFYAVFLKGSDSAKKILLEHLEREKEVEK